MPRPLAKLVSMLAPKRRWAQFSLGTLLVVVTAICLGLAWKIGEEQRRQEAIVAALDLLLGELGLTYEIRDEVLLITTKAEEILETRLYPMAAMLDDPQSPGTPDDFVARLISTVVPDSWQGKGGCGTVRFFPPTKCLIVSQTEEVHDELRKRLP